MEMESDTVDVGESASTATDVDREQPLALTIGTIIHLKEEEESVFFFLFITFHLGRNRIRIGSLIQDANMFAPYADMLNHSCKPNCFSHWRFRDRMFEVMTNVGQRIKKGEEMTVNYMSGQRNTSLMQRYGLSSPDNPWDVLPFSVLD
ncbi:unnamed protein product [Lactuca virosa]|uniref:SET domain-containing protein n=1 Tax=Lactuca virosa TaxID=75947 RepID=A0AAU9NER5_9ASTR|nr:unnamed protein product [Lactuca virosa]